MSKRSADAQSSETVGDLLEAFVGFEPLDQEINEELATDIEADYSVDDLKKQFSSSHGMDRDLEALVEKARLNASDLPTTKFLKKYRSEPLPSVVGSVINDWDNLRHSAPSSLIYLDNSLGMLEGRVKQTRNDFVASTVWAQSKKIKNKINEYREENQEGGEFIKDKKYETLLKVVYVLLEAGLDKVKKEEKIKSLSACKEWAATELAAHSPVVPLVTPVKCDLERILHQEADELRLSPQDGDDDTFLRSFSRRLAIENVRSAKRDCYKKLVIIISNGALIYEDEEDANSGVFERFHKAYRTNSTLQVVVAQLLDGKLTEPSADPQSFIHNWWVMMQAVGHLRLSIEVTQEMARDGLLHPLNEEYVEFASFFLDRGQNKIYLMNVATLQEHDGVALCLAGQVPKLKGLVQSREDLNVVEIISSKTEALPVDFDYIGELQKCNASLIGREYKEAKTHLAEAKKLNSGSQGVFHKGMFLKMVKYMAERVTMNMKKEISTVKSDEETFKKSQTAWSSIVKSGYENYDSAAFALLEDKMTVKRKIGDCRRGSTSKSSTSARSNSRAAN